MRNESAWRIREKVMRGWVFWEKEMKGMLGGGGGGQEGNWNLRSWEGVSKDARNEF